jgi:hypothetical protein
MGPRRDRSRARSRARACAAQQVCGKLVRRLRAQASAQPDDRAQRRRLPLAVRRAAVGALPPERRAVRGGGGGGGLGRGGGGAVCLGRLDQVSDGAWRGEVRAGKRGGGAVGGRAQAPAPAGFHRGPIHRGPLGAGRRGEARGEGGRRAAEEGPRTQGACRPRRRRPPPGARACVVDVRGQRDALLARRLEHARREQQQLCRVARRPHEQHGQQRGGGHLFEKGERRGDADAACGRGGAGRAARGRCAGARGQRGFAGPGAGRAARPGAAAQGRGQLGATRGKQVAGRTSGLRRPAPRAPATITAASSPARCVHAGASAYGPSARTRRPAAPRAATRATRRRVQRL